VAHATAMAGALLEMLDASGARGIFATHLHGVLSMPLQLRHTTRMAMQTERSPDTGVLRSTMRMVAGECTESLAFEVAAECGMPPALLQRADALLPHALPHAAPAAPPPAGVQAAAPAARPKRNPPLSGTPLAVKTLEAAGAVLLRECAAVLSATEPLSLVRVLKGQTPPPFTVNRSALYILRLQRDGLTQFYCGESDTLPSRFATHARKYKDALQEALYVLVPVDAGAKSRARQLEKRAIQALIDAGFPVLSDTDASHTNFGQ
jgi:hypothetical protein